MKYRIYNEDKTNYVDTDFSNIRTIASATLLRKEALNDNITREDVFRYGVFTANLDTFLTRLNALPELMSFFDKESLKKEIKVLNELRNTNFNLKKMIKFFNEITEEYIEKNNIIEINDSNNGWKNSQIRTGSQWGV